MKFGLTEKIGFVATWGLLIGYFLIKANFLSATGLIYQAINLFGSIGIIYVSYKKSAKQPLILNIIWAAVALFAIWRILL